MKQFYYTNDSALITGANTLFSGSASTVNGAISLFNAAGYAVQEVLFTTGIVAYLVGSVPTLLNANVLAPVAAVSVSNITLSGSQVIDGYTTLNGDRILVTGQTTASQNGIYVVNTGGAWSFATDYNIGGVAYSGDFVYVVHGGVYGTSQWILTTPNPISVGSTSVTWTQYGKSSGVATAYQTVQGQGTNLPQENTLDFDSASFNITDDSVNGRTKVDITSSPSNAATLVGTGRTFNNGTGLTGFGDLSADRTPALIVPVSIANGGTNATTAGAAIDNLLPSQTGNSGLFLTTNGTDPSWAAAGSSDHSARIFSSATNTTLVAGTATAINFDTTRYDTDTFWSNAHPTRLTIPAGLGGKYNLWANVQLPNQTGGPSGAAFTLPVFLRINGTTIIGQSQLTNTGGLAGDGPYTFQVTSDGWNFTAGDYVELMVTQPAAATIHSINLVSSYSPEMTIRKVN